MEKNPLFMPSIRFSNRAVSGQRAQLSGKLLYVAEALPGAAPYLKDKFVRAEKVAEVKRRRGPLTIETYAIDLLEGAKGEVLDNSPPPEMQ